jgi:hypothetical protein
MLDRSLSKIIVGELVRVQGEAAVLGLLGVTQPRLKALTSGRGCLKDEQLLRISAGTGRSWMRWGVDPIARGSRTAEQKKLDAATYKMLDEIDPQPNPVSKPTRGMRSRQSSVSALQGSKFSHRQAV